jgi:tricarballylate dehydrogenase
MLGENWDIIVIGAGNAGFSAAISATQAGARVIILEATREEDWGGNSALTMNFRFPHDRLEDLTGFVNPDPDDESTIGVREWYVPYPPETYCDDLVRVSDGRCDRDLAHRLAFGAAADAAWLRLSGHRWVWRERANAVPGSMPIRLDGGGAALQARHLANARRLGIPVRFAHRMVALGRHEDGYRIDLDGSASAEPIAARTVILACGGFEANPDMRAQYLGEQWRDVALRGVPTNQGDGLRAALELGADRAGDWSSCHATPQNADLAPFMLPAQRAESQANSRYAFNVGITVNLDGERFVDEGSDYPNLIYAALGRAILAQPMGIAFQLFDYATVQFLPVGYFAADNLVSSDSLNALATHFSIDAARFEQTVADYNTAAHRQVDYARRDCRGTSGLTPPKSNWALRLDRPPYYLVPVRPGITFAFGGVRVDPEARVLDTAGRPIPGLFACGELAGGLFHGNYVGGSGLMFGTHLGRRAGESAANEVYNFPKNI